MFPISFNGMVYYPVQSEYTGRLWLDRNLGAPMVPTSMDNVDCYGDYFSFNDVVCPDGYRLPTRCEWYDEIYGWERKKSGFGMNPFDSVLRITFSGYMHWKTHTVYSLGTNGYYWTGNKYGAVNICNLYVNRHNAYTFNSNYKYKFSVRCIKDE